MQTLVFVLLADFATNKRKYFCILSHYHYNLIPMSKCIEECIDVD